MIRAPCSKSRILPAFRIFRVIRVAHLAYFRRFESFESFELHISRFSRESIISQQRRRENTPDYLALTVHDAGLYLQIVKDLGRRLTKAISQYSTPSGRGVGKDLHFEAIRKKGVVLSSIHTAKKMAQRVSVLTDSLSASSS